MFAALILLIIVGFFAAGKAEAQKTIDVGDYLRIAVIGAPEFTRTVRVRPDGTIPYPYLTDVPVVGMTTTEVQTLLVNILRRSIENPVVVVETPQQHVISVKVLGQVRRPGTLEVPMGTDIQTALSLAGGLAEHADPSRIKVLQPVGEGEGGETEYNEKQVDMRQFLATGDVGDLPKLQEEDLVVVPSVVNSTSVMVVGYVPKPGNYVPYPDSNVLNIILNAGGFSPSADRSSVRHLYQTSPGQYAEHTLDIEALIADGQVAQIPPVSGGDVIIVQDYDPFFTWDRVLAIMRDVSVIASAYLLYLRIDRLEGN